MCATQTAEDSPPLIDPRARPAAPAVRAVAILTWAQAVLGAQMPVHIILGGLAGALLTDTPALATLPVSLTVAGSMLGAPLMSWLMGRIGRRPGFLLAALCGAASGAIAAEAILARDFWMLCAGTALAGVYLAAQNLYRFAAVDLASPAFRPKAIGWVMAGGLVAAVLGPQIVKETTDWLAPVPYAGAYYALVVLNLVGALPLLALDIPLPPRPARGRAGGRTMREILRDRRIAVAMLCGMVSYALMSLVMTSTPLAMIACGFVTTDAAGVVQLHVLAMYGPSFVTGPLIARFGAPRVIATGLACLAAASMAALSGIEIENFAIALLLLGVGWNLGFIGATAMLAEAHAPEERARVQGLNDFLVMGLVTVASFASGALFATIGWEAVNLAILPVLATAAGALIWLTLTDPRGGR